MNILLYISIGGFILSSIAAHIVLLMWMRTMMKWQRSQDEMILKILNRELQTTKEAIKRLEP